MARARSNAQEARTALGMILDGEVDPLHTGAFLMLLRVKEETAEEYRRFRAGRARARTAAGGADTRRPDWPKPRGQAPAAAVVPAVGAAATAHGHRVLMHGCEPHARNRLFASQALPALGIAPARDWQEVREALDTRPSPRTHSNT